MLVPKEISRKQRAASAGFRKFLPRPPKQHFTTSMANMAPMTGSIRGVSGDRHSASIRPVTTAEKSFQVSPLWHSRSKANSEATAVNTDTSTTSSAWKPWNTTPRIVAGISVSVTTFMMKAVVHLSRTCGLEDRFNALFIFYLLPLRACAEGFPPWPA